MTEPFKKIATETVTYNEDAWPLDVMACLDSRPNWPVSVGVILGIEQRGHGSEDVAICCDPATADRIATAIHVAAAQVRAARGEEAELATLPYLARLIMNKLGDDYEINDIRDAVVALSAWLAGKDGV